MIGRATRLHRKLLITPTTILSVGVTLLIFVSSCGGVTTNPASPPNDFSSGNFSMNIVASDGCATLADPGRTRSWKVGLVKSGSSVSSQMQGWGDDATVYSQTSLAGTATGSSLMLAGYIYDTVIGCEESLCYRAEGTITATQSGNVINGIMNGVITYEHTSCTAANHRVTFARQ